MRRDLILEDFERALARLAEALAGEPSTDLEKAGCIQYFEFCFELAWKAIKIIGQDSGVADLNSPRACLRHAFSSGYITDEETWLRMLDCRNQMSHTYDASGALTVYESLGAFAPALGGLHRALKARAE